MSKSPFKALLFSFIVFGISNIHAEVPPGKSTARSVCEKAEICRHFDDLKEKGSTMFNGVEYEINENPSMVAQEGKNMLITREKLRSLKGCPNVEQGNLIFIGKSNVCGVKFSSQGYGGESNLLVLSKKEK